MHLSARKILKVTAMKGLSMLSLRRVSLWHHFSLTLVAYIYIYNRRKRQHYARRIPAGVDTPGEWMLEEWSPDGFRGSSFSGPGPGRLWSAGFWFQTWARTGMITPFPAASPPADRTESRRNWLPAADAEVRVDCSRV